MKILKISKYYSPRTGGIENHLELAVKYMSTDNDITVVVTDDEGRVGEEKLHGARIIRRPLLFKVFNNPFFFPGKKFWKSDADLIEVHAPYPSGEIFAYLWSLIKRKPLVVMYHSDLVKSVGFLYSPIRWFILNRASKIISTSKNYMDGSKILKKYRDKVSIVPLGVETRLYENGDGHKIRKRYSLENNIVALFVGRLIPYKGLKYLIDSIPDCNRDVKFLIAGSGELLEELKEQATRLGVSDRIIFCGSIKEEEKKDYYAAADFFVLPSIWKTEAFGIVQLEAMASGLPVVSCNIPGSGVPYVNINGKTGIVVKPENSKELSDAINLLSSDVNLRRTMSNAAKKRASEFNYIETGKKKYTIFKESLK